MPIRRPRGPKPTLRHVAFLEQMATSAEGSSVHLGAHATFLTMRLLDHWIALGTDVVTAESSARVAATQATAALGDDEELRAALASITDAMVALEDPDPQPVLPRVYALGKLHEHRGVLPQAADIYSTVARYVDSAVHLDLAYDAHMRHAFCLRNSGEFEWAEQAYATAAALAARARDRVRVLTSRLGQAIIEQSRGNLPAAAEQLEELQAEAEQLAAQRLVANILHARATLARKREDIPGAVRLAFSAFQRSTIDFDRERVLQDLATFLMLYGDDDAARTAYQLMEAGTQAESNRMHARLGLMELGYRSRNEASFESYRRKLADMPLHTTLRTSYLLDAGRGLTIFGRFPEARASLIEALRLAETSEQNQRVFQIEESLAALDAAERKDRKAMEEIAYANRPEQKSAPDDIAHALEELLAEVATAG